MALFSVDFIQKAINTLLPVVCGVPDTLLNSVHPRYVVTITGDLKSGTAAEKNAARSWLGYTVNGYLQDKITINALSTWKGATQDIPGWSEIERTLTGVGNVVGQALLNRTTISTWMTRRIWAGSTPISINMKLKFEAFDDPEREVVLPCAVLQGLLFPRGGINGTGLITPGPNPFDVNPKGEPKSERNETISLNIGNGFLKLDTVIVKDVRVTFENRMGDSGPIGAEVELAIESYQMPTREELLAMYTLAKSSARGSTVGQGG